MDPSEAARWLAEPPSRLWESENKNRASHRHRNTQWQPREPSVDEEHAAVREGLRAAHVAIWRDLWSEVCRLRKENRELRRALARRQPEGTT